MPGKKYANQDGKTYLDILIYAGREKNMTATSWPEIYQLQNENRQLKVEVEKLKIKIDQLNHMLDVTQEIAIDCINDGFRGDLHD